MVIDKDNCHIGNKAMASVLLLYYHLIEEGGFTNDQTIYIDPDDFNGFKYIDVQVNEGNMSLGISEDLLRKGALVYLVCELNDMVAEYEEDYLSQEHTHKILQSLTQINSNDFPEIKELTEVVSIGENELNYRKYESILANIYKSYVYSRFKSILG